MNLRQGNIRVRELLGHPGAKQILQDELPELMGSPLLSLAGNKSLNQVLSYANGRVPPEKISRILQKLREL